MNTAIIGVGRMGRRHVRAARSLGWPVVGVCDAMPESLGLAAREESVPDALHFQDPRAMLVQTRPECVIIATTAPTHAELTILAAELGATHILCEKPMATSLAECDAMIEACARRGVRLAVNHQMRFMEQYTEPKRLLASEAFGGVASVTCVDGNFGLAMNGSHYFEMFRFITDERPTRITAWFSERTVPNPRGAQFADRAGAVRLETPRGRRFYMEAGADQGHGMQVIYAARTGTIYVDELYGHLRAAARETEHRALPTTRYGMPADREAREIAPADAVAPSASVLQALADGTDYPSGEDGRLTVELLVAAYLSDERGHVAVDIAHDVLPRDRTFPWA